MKKRNTGSRLLAAVVSILLLSGCAGEPAAPAADSGAQDAPAETVTLKFTGWRTEDMDAINRMNQQFTAKYPNIQVVYEPVAATEYDTYLQTAIANGTAADLIMMRSYSAGKTVYSGGKVETLTEETVPNLKNYPESALHAWASDGKSFAVPVGMTVEAVHYNRDIFEACGITKEPETVAELLEICRIIRDKGYMPLAGGVGEAWYVSEEITSSILMATIGSSDWVDRLYSKEIDFTDAAYVQMLQTLKDLAAYYPDLYQGLGYDDCQQLFVAGQAAMYMSGSFELEFLTTTNPDLHLGCFAFPGLDGPAEAINFTAAVGVGAFADSAHLEEAMLYLNWLASDEGGGAYANGVLGFFSPNPTAAALDNEIAQQWSELRNGRESIHMLGYETMTESAPDYSTAIADTVLQMCSSDLSAEEAAAYMQQQMSWYFS